MKERIKLIGRLALFWIGFFELSRILFLVYHMRLAGELPLSDLLLVLVYGLKMDISVTGYLLLIPCLMLVSTSDAVARSLYPFLKYYTGFLLLIFSFIIVSDMELYRHWGFRLDDTPLLYLQNPKEVMGSSDSWVTIRLVIFWLIFSVSAFQVFRVKILPHCKLNKAGDLKLSIFFFTLALALILPIRGSLGPSNMNVGFVYFHNSNTFANHAAVNVVWNLQYYLLKSEQANYPDNFFTESKTKQYFDDLYRDSGSTKSVLNTDRPNIILIALESYTSKIVGVLGGIEGVTPNIDSLVREGILFDNIFSNGDRTEDGMVSILSGYPAQPRTSIMKFPQKTQNLPFLSRELKEMGYHTNFIFGYDIDYANFRSYLVNANFDVLKSRMDFSPKDRTSKWGVHDHIVLDKIMEELDSTPSPFLMCSMTLSSHEPFNVPMETVFSGGENQQFFNSAYYTDKSIGDFVAEAKTKKWWDNTLIILVADHGSRLPNNDSNYAKGKFSIPMLWLGGALTVKDTVIHTVASHTDIAKTLLNQLETDGASFEFSKNLFSDQARSFAFYTFNNGFGFVGDTYELVFDNDAREFTFQDGAVDKFHEELGQSYMQKVFWDFNTR